MDTLIEMIFGPWWPRIVRTVYRACILGTVVAFLIIGAGIAGVLP